MSLQWKTCSVFHCSCKSLYSEISEQSREREREKLFIESKENKSIFFLLKTTNIVNSLYRKIDKISVALKTFLIPQKKKNISNNKSVN